VLTCALAVLAACANGLSSVLQRKANKQVSQRENLSPRLIWSLLRLPAAGMTAGLGGLLYLLAPSSGKQVPVHWYLWLAGIGVNLTLIGCLTAWARSRPTDQASEKSSGHQGGPPRAALLATAAGSTFGLARP
jgi:hypothetical protein